MLTELNIGVYRCKITDISESYVWCLIFKSITVFLTVTKNKNFNVKRIKPRLLLISLHSSANGATVC